jgi:hypothetical protein
VGPGRFLKALMDYFPGLGPALNLLSRSTKLMASVADYRETQRSQSRSDASAAAVKDPVRPRPGS